MRIIPAIDIIGGSCVRLTGGDYSSVKVYGSDPIEMALRFEDLGFRYLHLVDLDGAKEKKVINHKILRAVAAGTSLQVDFGGGIQSDEDIRAAFESGAAAVNIGSVAARNPELFLRWLEEYGSSRIILSADCRGRKIVTSAWSESTGTDVVDYISAYYEKGVRYTACTDVTRDGMLNGPSLDLYREIMGKIPVSLIASGGVSAMKDVEMLKEAGCEGAIIGKAVYEGKIDLKELSQLC